MSPPKPTSFSGNPAKLSPKGSQICEILHRLFVQSASCSRLLFLPLLPCGCCCYPRAGSTRPMPSDRTTCRQLLERACKMPSTCCRDALGVFALRVLCGSTALRRGAAPYADGCECFFVRSRLISLLLFAVLGLSSRLTWHDFAYVTMAQKVPSSTLVPPWPPNPSFLEGFGPYIPVAPDPPSQPRDHRSPRGALCVWPSTTSSSAPTSTRRARLRSAPSCLWLRASAHVQAFGFEDFAFFGASKPKKIPASQGRTVTVPAS